MTTAPHQSTIVFFEDAQSLPAENAEAFRASLRGFLGEHSSEAEVRRLMETDEGYDRQVWLAMARELELQGLVIPELYGGSGFNLSTLVVAFEEMGRALLCAPYFASVALAGTALLLADNPSPTERHIRGIASGETTATLASTEITASQDANHISLAAVKLDEDAYALTGTKYYVIDGATADLYVVSGLIDGKLGLFLVDRDAPGLAVAAMSTLDLTRKQARIEFQETPASLLVGGRDAERVLSRVLDYARVALAAEQLGGAQACLDLSTRYAIERVQFGRQIGSFQAIKHKCADMLCAVERARSAVSYAAQAEAADATEFTVAAPLALACCSEAFSFVAAETIQIHGGIGFTWEHPAHLYFRRAKTSELLFGDVSFNKEQMLQRMGI